MHFLIVGTGSIGERHLRNFLRIDGVRCSIAELNPVTRERVASEYPVVASYEKYTDADLAGFSGVVICVPANLHVAIATDAVAAGTHVLTEKPLAVSREGIAELRQLRDRQGVVVSVAFCRRSDPLYREVKERLDAGELGKALWASVYVGQYWPHMRQDYPPVYSQKRETGGGVIPDMLVHDVNFLEWLFGPVEAVSAAHWRMVLNDIGTEDSGVICLRFHDGQVAQFGVCLFQHPTEARFLVVGQKGALRIQLDAERLGVFSNSSSRWEDGRTRSFERDDVFRQQAQHFIDCIEGRAEPLCTLEDAEQTLLTVLAALESADGDGRFVNVPKA